MIKADNILFEKRYVILNEIILSFIILASLRFYDIILIPDKFNKILEMGAIALMLGINVIYSVYSNPSRIKKGFSIEIWIMLIAVVISMFGAYYFHKQSFGITFITQRSVYFFLIYFTLFHLRPSSHYVEKIILSLGVVYCLLYILQFFAYPYKFINSNVFMDRGTIRIFMPGSGYMFITYFIGLAKYFSTKKVKYLFISFLAMIIVVLLGTRQLLASVVLLSFLYILFSKRIKSKLAIFFLIAACSVPVFFLFQDIFLAMLKVTTNQQNNISGNIRVRAATFFLFEFFPNKLSYIIGNGAPSTNSPYGLKIQYFSKALGFYQSDIGIIGEYTKYGILFATAELIILGRIIFMKLSENIVYIKYYMLSALLTIFVGAGTFGNSPQIVTACLLFYMIDVNKYIHQQTILKQRM